MATLEGCDVTLGSDLPHAGPFSGGASGGTLVVLTFASIAALVVFACACVKLHYKRTWPRPVSAVPKDARSCELCELQDARYCELCDMWLGSPAKFEDHLIGPKRRKVLRRAMRRAAWYGE